MSRLIGEIRRIVSGDGRRRGRAAGLTAFPYLQQDDDGVTSVIRDRITGDTRKVRSR
jgi:hypothetical protein